MKDTFWPDELSANVSMLKKKKKKKKKRKKKEEKRKKKKKGGGGGGGDGGTLRQTSNWAAFSIIYICNYTS